MAQPSVAQYFSSRKRPATDDYPLANKKIIKLDQENPKKKQEQPNPVNLVLASKLQKFKQKLAQEDSIESTDKVPDERCVTPPPPSGPSTINRNAELDKIKLKLSKHPKLNKLKESLDKFKSSAEQLKNVERRIKDNAVSPELKTFKSIEFEVCVSPSKVSSPEKLYLSPKKELSVRRNLLNVLSPTKKTVEPESKSKHSLQLPFKYRTLTEIFRAVDTVAQILYNRKEKITFGKLKPAVEEMAKKTFTQKHLAQIKSVHPSAYNYTKEKIKQFGHSSRQQEWDLVLTPVIHADAMTTQILLNRRKAFFETLINKVKDYHNEFLLSLTPPIVVSKENVSHWHPEFDLEKVPEIELAELPQCTASVEYTGKEVLETARRLFGCNTRMNEALATLSKNNKNILPQENGSAVQTGSIIKGIPEALLAKVRQRQAAKALVTMTRTSTKETELKMYARLPELARLIRSLFVTEKKTVLERDIVLEKLGNSYRNLKGKVEIENHLKMISKEVPDWLKFLNLRNTVYLKLDKNADLNVILTKLEKLIKEND